MNATASGTPADRHQRRWSPRRRHLRPAGRPVTGSAVSTLQASPLRQSPTPRTGRPWPSRWEVISEALAAHGVTATYRRLHNDPICSPQLAIAEQRDGLQIGGSRASCNS